METRKEMQTENQIKHVRDFMRHLFSMCVYIKEISNFFDELFKY